MPNPIPKIFGIPGSVLIGVSYRIIQLTTYILILAMKIDISRGIINDWGLLIIGLSMIYAILTLTLFKYFYPAVIFSVESITLPIWLIILTYEIVTAVRSPGWLIVKTFYIPLLSIQCVLICANLILFWMYTILPLSEVENGMVSRGVLSVGATFVADDKLLEFQENTGNHYVYIPLQTGRVEENSGH